jgi:probable F420-dependent oxidoreductase
VTTKLRLLTYLAVGAYRNPLLLAKSAATVDKLSGGRFILGLGAGYAKTEFFALGVGYEERGALLDEALEVLPLHWGGEPFSFTGRHFQARDVIARPKPVQSPIPIWIGGNADAALRRVATKAQGWMPLVGGEDLFRTTKAPGISSVAELGAKIDELKLIAGDRAASLDITLAYHDLSPDDPGKEAERHHDAIGQLAAIGVKHLVVSAPTRELSATTDFLNGVSETYFAAHS